MSRVAWESRVANPNGVHCRVAAKLSEIAATYDAEVRISGAQGEADCSSILEILSLALIQGSRVAFTAEGPDAEQVAKAINRLLSSGEKA